ncbi:MAG: 30S ribosomal protein S8e [Candidatus Diapherotrites archaeon]|nr:30S ribosomal protein S8e [Candidatus Diapherotrites archaeon]
MVQWHMRDDKKPSGGKRDTINARDKKLAWKGGLEAMTKTDATIKTDKVETKKGLGNTLKVRALELKHANVTNGKGKTTKVEIVSVKDNSANRLYGRANISTKGAIIRVKFDGAEKLAQVTSRPGQSGVVNAKLIE